MKHLTTTLAAALAFTFAASAQAAPIPYANEGTESNVQYEFRAAATGDVVAYFAGSDASYMNEIALLVNGVDTGIRGLNNQTSVYGQMLNFGLVSAGDRLVFKLVNLNPADVGPFYSDRSLNSDGFNHIYSAAYGGDGEIPAGIAVGFEDLRNGGDFDYNDENFVFVNVANATDVPEPASIALLLAGVAGLGMSRRAKRARKA
ncbi:DUF4114 domain-containing protein [Massilia sp. CMS3.1]|uniref:DUF4114 domain-containing protein n=1 Tax=Massilia sp. CMS3.1 TaxID=3373083 RepID=UPI003EE6273E